MPLELTVANLEIEMIGRPDSLAGGRGKGWLTGFDRSTMGETLAAAGIPVVADPRPEYHFFERSDNIAFALPRHSRPYALVATTCTPTTTRPPTRSAGWTGTTSPGWPAPPRGRPGSWPTAIRRSGSPAAARSRAH